jgi:hypothetical protein
MRRLCEGLPVLVVNLTQSCSANPAGFIDGVTVGVMASVLIAFYILRKHYK